MSRRSREAHRRIPIKKMILLSMILSNLPSALIETPLQDSRGSAPPPPKKMILTSIILSNLCTPTCQNRHIPPFDATRPVSNALRHVSA
jgi:hypothetical protein